MWTYYLVSSLVILALVYYFANTTLTNTDYLLLLVALVLGTALVYRYFPKVGSLLDRVHPQTLLDKTGLDDFFPLMSGEADVENGSVSCYQTPYKVVKTQYGDQAVLAGYNELVRPAQTGAEANYQHPMEESDETCHNVKYEAQPIYSSM